jgi:hypothetical protein
MDELRPTFQGADRKSAGIAKRIENFFSMAKNAEKFSTFALI